MQEESDDQKREVSRKAGSETDKVAVLEIQQHSLNGKKVENWPQQAEKGDCGDCRKDCKECEQDKDCFEEARIGVQSFGGLLAVGGFAEPARAETSLELLQERRVIERRGNLSLAKVVPVVAVGDGNLADSTAQRMDGLRCVRAEKLCGLLLFLLVLRWIVVRFAEQSCAGDSCPWDGLGPDAALRVNGRVVELDVHGEGAEVYMEMSAHGGVILVEKRGSKRAQI